MINSDTITTKTHNKKLGIACVCNYPHFGGLEMQTIRRAADALARGYKAWAIVSHDTPSEEYAQKLGVPTLFVSQTLPYIAPKTSIDIAHMIDEHSIDVFVCGKTESLSVTGLALRFSGRHRGNFLYQQMQSGINKRDFFHNTVYKQLSGAIVLTERMKQQLLETTICSEDKIAVIPYGIDTDRFDPNKHNKAELKSQLNILPDQFVVGTMSRIDPSKGIDVLMRAFATADLGNSILTIAGGTDLPDYAASLRALATYLGIADRTKFLPFTEKQEEYMAALDVFALASHSETFGLVYAEAQAAGLVTIGTNGGGVPEIIKHGETGFLIPPADVNELSAILKHCYSEQEQIRRIGMAARMHAIECYDYNSQTDSFFDFIEQRIQMA